MFRRVVRPCRLPVRPQVCVRCTLALAIRGLSSVPESSVSSAASSGAEGYTAAAGFNGASNAAPKAADRSQPSKPKPEPVQTAEDGGPDAPMTIGEAMKAAQETPASAVAKKAASKRAAAGKKTAAKRKAAKPAVKRPQVKVASIAPKKAPNALFKPGTTPTTTEVLSSKNLKISVKIPIPKLSYGLERVLFNRGVYELQDPRTRVYNFDPYLQTIMPVSEFDFSALKKYITSSKDKTLQKIAAENTRKYSGSSSSMTSVLAQFHYLLSAWRPLNTNMLSKSFPAEPTNFTAINRAPAAIFLKKNEEGTYAIDADKEFDTANILSMLGRSMEKLLTLPKEGYERYRKQNSSEITEEEKNEPEAFHYSTMGDFLMRSQLDAHDPRLPGTGTFDLKTRAVVTVRMDAENYQLGYDYEIMTRQGQWESYEREFFDMMRAAFMKYSLQVRMGRMDGIFVAFHNTQRIFGFQYVSLNEMDETLHGTQNPVLGDTEFRLSIGLLNKVLDKITEKIPDGSIRLHFETREGSENFMYIFAEPVTDDDISKIQSATKARVEAFENDLMGMVNKGAEKAAAVAASEQDAALLEELDEDGDDTPSAEAVEALIQRLVSSQPDELATGSKAVDQGEPLSAKHFSSPSTTPSEPSEATTSDSSTAATDTAESATTSSPPSSSASTSAKPNDPPQVYGWVLTLRNKINGQPFLRPIMLSEKDEWSVDYSFAEISTQQRTQSLYNACRVRRQKALEKFDDDDSARMGFFLRQMRNLSQKGKRFRMRRDREDLRDGKKIVVLGSD